MDDLIELLADIVTAEQVLTGDAIGEEYTHDEALTVDPHEERNLAGVAGYEPVTSRLCQRLLAHRIRLTQYTHHKEEARLQRVRVPE